MSRDALTGTYLLTSRAKELRVVLAAARTRRLMRSIAPNGPGSNHVGKIRQKIPPAETALSFYTPNGLGAATMEAKYPQHIVVFAHLNPYTYSKTSC